MLPPVLSLLVVVVVGGLCTSMTWIAMLAGVFILLVGPPKSDRLKDKRQTKSQHRLFFLFTFLFFSPLLSYYSALLFLLFRCLSRPYITFMPCSNVKPLSLTHSIRAIDYSIVNYYVSGERRQLCLVLICTP